MNATQRLLAQVPADYRRPICPICHETMQLVHIAFIGSRYACVTCAFGLVDVDVHPAPPITASEASWIIRHQETAS